GPLPGNGSMVAALRHATGAVPVATGKPDPAMHRESVRRSGARNPVVVGDRLDTDIEGANAVGCASLLVLSGVTHPVDLLSAPPRQRPTFVARDLGGLLYRHRTPVRVAGGFECGGWAVHPESDALHLGALPNNTAIDSSGVHGDDGLDALRALCACAWDTDRTLAGADIRCIGDGALAAAELARLGLDRPTG
ncbi:MAG TPA: HAD hydrolase-like protein, partial [Jatrophihabitantaceae bacterium]|nr:HAD hydrolase-like protein [Jatrophihabitantaceae bacterium]